eukprot:gene8676-8857_t
MEILVLQEEVSAAQDAAQLAPRRPAARAAGRMASTTHGGNSAGLHGQRQQQQQSDWVKNYSRAGAAGDAIREAEGSPASNAYFSELANSISSPGSGVDAAVDVNQDLSLYRNVRCDESSAAWSSQQPVPAGAGTLSAQVAFEQGCRTGQQQERQPQQAPQQLQQQHVEIPRAAPAPSELSLGGAMQATQPPAAGGVLLHKYNLPHPATKAGPAQQQSDELVDQLVEQILITWLWDPPSRQLQTLMVNVETCEVEAYPQGWWQQVAQALDLTIEQKASLKLCWSKLKVILQRLTSSHQDLSARLASLQLQQQQQMLNSCSRSSKAGAIPGYNLCDQSH